MISKYEDDLNSSFWETSLTKSFGSKPLQFVFLKEKKALANIVDVVRRDLGHVVDVVESDVIENESYTKTLFEKISRGHAPKSWLDSDGFTDLRSSLDALVHRKQQLELWHEILSRPRRLLPSKDRETVFDAVRSVRA